MKLNSIDISEYGLYLLKMPPVVKPPKRVRRITIPGRSGHLTEWSGDYESYTKEPELYCAEADLADALEALRNAMYIEFDNEPGYVYDVSADEVIEAAVEGGVWYRITARYFTQPLKRQAIETVYKDAISYSITNPGNEPAYPKLVITGAGVKTVTIGTQTITISFATLGETITIDALNGQIYDDDGNNAWNKVTGDLPMIPVSTSAITISTTASALTVYPNWRWS